MWSVVLLAPVALLQAVFRSIEFALNVDFDCV
jgi:hypothetical protein